MKSIVLLVSMAAFLGAAVAQTPPSSSTPHSAAPSRGTAMTAKPAGSAAKPGATPGAAPATPPWIKLPPGVPHVVHGPLKTPISLHYEDIKVGTGALGESNKMWHIKYTGWRAADGVKFDSWDSHQRPVIDANGKPELGPDGKPKMQDPEPLEFPQGMGRVIPGFDYGLDGMHVGGKRRIFIPWQLAYGTRAMPDRPDHPGIPAKSDLIFDVELVSVTDLPTPPQRPMMPPRPAPSPTPVPPPHPGATPGATPNAGSGSPSAPSTPSATPQATAPSSTPNPSQPSTPPPTPQPQK